MKNQLVKINLDSVNDIAELYDVSSRLAQKIVSWVLC